MWCSIRICLCALAVSTLLGNSSLKADVILSEVFYDRNGLDSGFEWVEIFNSGPDTVDLSSFSLGYGGANYIFGTVQLAGTIARGEYFVIGGASSDATNGNPVFDVFVDFSPDIQNSGTTADGMALFDVTAASLTASTVPIDVVIYGGSNDNLIDETGSVGAVDVGDAAAGNSIVFDGTSWSITSSLTPGTGSLTAVPEPSSSLLTLCLAASGCFFRRRRRW